MAVIIGSACGDERGKLTGGQAGDQTGHEVSTQAWYRASGGWRVLRAKDPDVAEAIAWDMQAACDNNAIGYDQSQNQTLYAAVLPYNFDCSKVAVPCETDCSQLVRVCCWYAGIEAPFFYTGNEATILLATGAFTELTTSDYQYRGDYLRRGDILVTKQKGHTVVVLTDGPKAYIWGTDLTIAAQRKYGTPADGEIWGQYTPNRKYVPNAGSGWKWALIRPRGSKLIEAMQLALAAEGYEVGKVDGIVGKLFVLALQSFLNKELHSGLDVDGVMGVRTVKAFFGYVNS